MTSLRDLLDIKVSQIAYSWRYSAGGHEIGMYNPWGPSYVFDYESDGVFRHRSEYEAWLVQILTQQYAQALPGILRAGEAKWLSRKTVIPFYMHYYRPADEGLDCE